MKTCSKCKAEKSVDDFGKDSRASDGKRTDCKKCVSDYNAARRATHPIPKEYFREYRARHPEVTKAAQAQWKERNPELAKEVSRRDRHRRRAIQHGVDAEIVNRQVVWERDQGVCHICDEPVSFDEMHLDHVVPLSRGGAHAYDNVASAHPACNMRKGSKLIEEMA